MPYEVQLPLFAGPMDLLLHLIEREELEITAVSIARIADQFLEYLARIQDHSADELSDFIVMAARLVWIKSRALLPRPFRLEEGNEEENPGEALARQLRDYKRFRDAAAWLSEREALGTRAFVRTAAPPVLPQRIIPGEGAIEDLLQALRGILDDTEPDALVNDIVTPLSVTISQQIGHILESTRGAREIRFHQLLNRAATRVEIIVTLLAMLELVKRRRVTMRQSGLFAEIYIVGLDGVYSNAVASEDMVN